MKIFRILVLVLFCFSTTVTYSQIDLGIKVGANFSTISDATANSSKTGFIAGAFGGGKLSKKWALQGEVLYSQQGAKFNAFKFDVDYINVPIIIKRYTFLGMNLQFGPQFGFVVNDNSSELSEDIQAGFKSNNFDFSGVVGLGYDIIFGLRIDARYQFGFTNITDVAGYSGQNQVFTLGFGYTFL